jgi:polysaccharide export outer membrane protein
MKQLFRNTRTAVVVLLLAAATTGCGLSRGGSPIATVPSAAAPEYLIGAEDVLNVMFWREQDMTVEVAVRSDGMITLPLIGDIKAAGLRPDALGAEIQKSAARFLEDPAVTVAVRQPNSQKVFITGQVTTPGAHALTGPRTVMQLIALAGGLTEYADSENITIVRLEGTQTRSYRFNYQDVAKGKMLQQNIALQAGDTVVVP